VRPQAGNKRFDLEAALEARVNLPHPGPVACLGTHWACATTAVFTTADCSLAGGSVCVWAPRTLHLGKGRRLASLCVLLSPGSAAQRHPPLRSRETSAQGLPSARHLSVYRSIQRATPLHMCVGTRNRHTYRHTYRHTLLLARQPGTGSLHPSIVLNANWLRTISIISAAVTSPCLLRHAHALFAVTTEMLPSKTF
jgi:hypothetical protein